MSEDQFDYAIPAEDVSTFNLKGLMEGYMKNLPVEMSAMGLKLNEGASEEDVIKIGLKLYRAQNRLTVETRFQLGDWWNQAVFGYGGKMRLAAKMTNILGENAYKSLACYGWVARKWPEPTRSSKYAWSHFKNRFPGQPKQDKPEVSQQKQKIKAAVLMWDRGKWKDFEAFYAVFSDKKNRQEIAA